MAEFVPESLTEGLERALAAASHLTDRDAAAIAAARALAHRIDVWDVIVQWAMEDAADTESRPKVPANDNTSLPTYLKYLDALQLLPPAATDKAKPGPASSASPSQQALTEMRKGLSVVPEVG